MVDAKEIAREVVSLLRKTPGESYTVQELMERTALSKDFVYRHAPQIGGHFSAGSEHRFDAATVNYAIQQGRDIVKGKR